MAVSIDRVYQKVLALANKEQRGYITPQEFNLFADQAQMEIFEQYFYDTSQFKRRPASNSEYHDMVELIDEKLRTFRHVEVVYNGSQVDFYKIGSVFTGSTIVEQVKFEDFVESEISPLTKSSHDRPIYYHTGSGLRFSPPLAPTGTQYRMDYIKKPSPPNWTYLLNHIDNSALYNPSAPDHQDFELHISEEPKLVIKILQLAGVNTKDYNLTQLAAQKEASIIQQEKQ